ncbi:MAG TPA: type II toxin-antitoxin system VapB family antitoxin [Chloroflexota bacterium]|jgi:Arc/MetJ family transcription regulator|nr:type II toxin-antitoxin system VapB family antitoxin [Chloroflexota bacterium]
MKHLVDMDDELLEQAKACLGTPTIKATVDEALRIVTNRRAAELREAMRRLGEIFAEMPDFDRSQAW